MDYKTGLNIKTFETKALIGRRVGYSSDILEEKDIKMAVIKAAEDVEGYVFSGTITPTDILVAGSGKEYQEPAYAIETSIYPKFPVEVKKFKEDFIKFIGNLLLILKQERTGIIFSDESLLIETKYCKNPSLE
ncbi:MAG: hypothetical protein AAB622_01470 [Patescibacteria group bacterium]